MQNNNDNNKAKGKQENVSRQYQVLGYRVTGILMSWQWEDKMIQPLWKTVVCYSWICGYPGASNSTASCIRKKTHVCAEDMYKNLHNITSHKSLALETFQMVTNNRIDNELCHVYAMEHGPAMRKRELLRHKKVRVKSPSLWVDWVWLPFPYPGGDIKQIWINLVNNI